jgi:hypothetical protein
MSCVAANWFQLSSPVIVGFAILFIAERTAINRSHSGWLSDAGPLLWLIVGIATLMVVVSDCT